MHLKISPLQANQGAVCNKILRSLPKWFGIEEAIVQYVRDVERMLTYVAADGDETIGFISIHIHNEWAAEVHVMGICEQYHGKGIGTRLLSEAETKLRELNIEYLTVKTLSPAKESAEYEKTRKFYFTRGFRPLEEFKTLWGANNPCLLMVKRLTN